MTHALITAIVRRTAPLGRVLRELAGARDANVMMIAAVALIPSLFGLGFCIDYARAEMLQSRIAAVADAAALAATDIVYIQQTASVAKAAATTIFTTQVTDYKDFTYSPSTDLTITVSNQGGLNLGRTVVVTWTGQSANMFSGILGKQTLAIGGTSTAYATQAPNMNFFLVMDKSPSMLLPTTTTGISAVQGATADGCAFACHQKFPGNNYVKDHNGKFVFLDQNYYTTGNANAGVYYLIDSSNNIYKSDGTLLGVVQTSVNSTINTDINYKVTTVTTTTKKGVTTSTTTYSYVDLLGFYADGYWLTHNYPTVYPSGSAIDLRVSDETAAATALIPYAQSQATLNAVTYQLQFFSFDWTHPASTSPVTQHNAMTNVNSLTSANVPNLDTTQDWWYQNSQPTAATNNDDKGSEFANMMTSMNTAIPAPGTGLTATSPQEVMLLITDGVVDEDDGGRRHQELGATDLAKCTAIKNRGIKIAILYTEYALSSIDSDGWSHSNVSPYLPNVLGALQSCASNANNGSPLVYTVQSNQSISTALQTLFQLTIANSHLVQ